MERTATEIANRQRVEAELREAVARAEESERSVAELTSQIEAGLVESADQVSKARRDVQRAEREAARAQLEQLEDAHERTVSGMRSRIEDSERECERVRDEGKAMQRDLEELKQEVASVAEWRERSDAKAAQLKSQVREREADICTLEAKCRRSHGSRLPPLPAVARSHRVAVSVRATRVRRLTAQRAAYAHALSRSLAIRA